MTDFKHKALDLQEEKTTAFVALSKKYFYMRYFLTAFALEEGYVPLCGFTTFEYFLTDAVDRDIVRNGNNNLLRISDELWVFGSISNGVLAEIRQAKEQGKPIKYFKIENDKDVFEISKGEVEMEDEVSEFKDEL